MYWVMQLDDDGKYYLGPYPKRTWVPDISKAIKFKTKDELMKKAKSIWSGYATGTVTEEWFNESNITFVKIEEMEDHRLDNKQRCITQ